MCNITVGRYGPPCGQWVGWIEPDDKSWIAFITTDGRPEVYLDRDPVTGAVR